MFLLPALLSALLGAAAATRPFLLEDAALQADSAAAEAYPPSADSEEDEEDDGGDEDLPNLRGSLIAHTRLKQMDLFRGLGNAGMSFVPPQGLVPVFMGGEDVPWICRCDKKEVEGENKKAPNERTCPRAKKRGDGNGEDQDREDGFGCSVKSSGMP